MNKSLTKNFFHTELKGTTRISEYLHSSADFTHQIASEKTLIQFGLLFHEVLYEIILFIS